MRTDQSGPAESCWKEDGHMKPGHLFVGLFHLDLHVIPVLINLINGLMQLLAELLLRWEQRFSSQNQNEVVLLGGAAVGFLPSNLPGLHSGQGPHISLQCKLLWRL